eukprot:936804_1
MLRLEPTPPPPVEAPRPRPSQPPREKHIVPARFPSSRAVSRRKQIRSGPDKEIRLKTLNINEFMRGRYPCLLENISKKKHPHKRKIVDQNEPTAFIQQKPDVAQPFIKPQMPLQPQMPIIHATATSTTIYYISTTSPTPTTTRTPNATRPTSPDPFVHPQSVRPPQPLPQLQPSQTVASSRRYVSEQKPAPMLRPEPTPPP